jgi:hypothetical protein
MCLSDDDLSSPFEDGEHGLSSDSRSAVLAAAAARPAAPHS